MNVIEIFAKFVVDTSDFDKGLDQASNKASSVGSSIAKGLGGAALGAATALASAGVAAATAVGAVAKQATDAYSSYQQLAGGIETLFDDQQAMNMVMDNASNAFKTAGMSTNDYMDTVINMAASLNKATGDYVESAKLADVAITDMADNVNKMGTSMEAVQNAYRGFTRGNFTMLDNLALGYAGTKEGMEELLADAEKISGIKYDVSSYADIVNAIHVVQQNMGITGTTAAEAADTVSGSMGAMKAAWDNLILGLADPNADLGALIDNMVQSAKGAFGNMIPVFTQAIKGVGSLVGEIAPVITAELPGIIDEVLPPLLDAAESLLSNVASAIPGLIGSIVDQIPKVLESLTSVVGTLGNSLGELLTTLLSPDTFTAIASTISSLFENITGGMSSALTSILQGLPQFISNIISGLSDSAEIIVGMIPTVLDNIGQAIIDNAPILEQSLEQILPMLGDAFIGFFDSATNIMGDIIESIANPSETKKGMGNAIQMAFNSFVEFLRKYLPKFETELAKVAPDFWAAFVQLIGVLAEQTGDIIEAVSSIIPDVVEAMVDILTETGMIETVVNGWMQIFEAVTRVLPTATEPILELIPSIVNAITRILVESAPILIEAMGLIAEAVIAELPNLFQLIIDTLPAMWDALVVAFFTTWEAQGDIWMELWNRISPQLEGAFNSAQTSIMDWINGIIQPILEFFAPLAELFMPIVEAWGRYLNALWELVSVIFEKITGKISAEIDGWLSIFDTVWTAIMDLIRPILDDLLFWFEDGFTQLSDIVSVGLDDCMFWFEDMVNSITEIVEGLINDALFWGSDLVSNFVEGITGNMDKVTGAIDGMTKFIDDNIGFSEPEEGPLSDFHTFAPDMMELFAQGIRDNTSIVDRAIGDAFNFGGDIKGSMPGGNVPGLITPTAGSDLTVVLQVNEEQLGKVVYRLNNNETQRVGIDLGKAVMA